MIPGIFPAVLLVLLAAPDALEDAEAHLRKGEAAPAREVLEKRIAEGPANAEKVLLLECLGRCHRAAGRFWDAEAAFSGALEIRPRFPEAALGLGRTYLDLARGAAGGPRPTGAEVRALAADAKRWLAAALEDMPGDPLVLRLLAEAKLLDLDHDGAAATLRSLLEKSPGDAAAHHLLALALRGLGDRAGAAKEEAATLEIDPAFPGAAALRVADLVAAGDAPAARAAAREALLRDPADDAVYAALWRAEASDGRFAALEETILAVLAKHPDHPKALHYLGFAQEAGGRRDAALETFRRKDALEPGNAQTLLRIGRLLVGRGEHEEAERTLAKAAAGLDPEGPDFAVALDALRSVGGAHGVARRFADAERVFRRITDLDPRDYASRTFLGLSLRRLGRLEEAETVLKAAVESAPFDGSPLNELGLLYLGWGRLDEARARFAESAERDPRTTSALETLGNLDRAAGNFDDALRAFREAHRRAVAFRDEGDRLKFRRCLDVVAREKEAAGAK